MTNAEKFKSAEERYKAFKAFCFTHNCGTSNNGKPRCPLCENINVDGVSCKFWWLELEYKEPEPELKPCPFCGGNDIRYSIGSLTNSTWVICVNCGCRSRECSSISSAIEKWNRRMDG